MISIQYTKCVRHLDISYLIITKDHNIILENISKLQFEFIYLEVGYYDTIILCKKIFLA